MRESPAQFRKPQKLFRQPADLFRKLICRASACLGIRFELSLNGLNFGGFFPRILRGPDFRRSLDLLFRNLDLLFCHDICGFVSSFFSDFWFFFLTPGFFF